MLGALGQDKLDELAHDDEFVGRVRAEDERLTAYLDGDRWFQRLEGDKPAHIAYFSPEFGVDGSLPQYSGGLGILAGDHLKSASDLGVPLTGVGLFYRAGYFRQSIGDDGWQREAYPLLDPYGLGLTLLRDARRRARRDHARPAGRPAACTPACGSPTSAASRCCCSTPRRRRTPTRCAASPTASTAAAASTACCRSCCSASAACARCARGRAITGRPAPDVYHTNEGHAGFQGLERMSELITQDGLEFDEALAQVRASTVFTTHTPGARRHRPVPARPHRGLPHERAVHGPRRRPRDRARPRDLRRRRPGRLQHGRPRPAPRPARQRRLGAARRGEPRHVRAALAGRRHRRGADHVDHQRRARADLGASGAQGRERARRGATRTPTRTTGPTARPSRMPSSGTSVSR